MFLLQDRHPAPTWLRAGQETLSDGPVLAGLSPLETPGVMARALADDLETLTRVMEILWQKIRQDIWGEGWHPWRKL
jgi:hypothetical protein